MIQILIIYQQRAICERDLCPRSRSWGSPRDLCQGAQVFDDDVDCNYDDDDEDDDDHYMCDDNDDEVDDH